MISRLIGVSVLPWAGLAASENHPWTALLLLAVGIAAVFWHTPKREPKVSAYRQRVRELDERGWEILDDLPVRADPDLVNVTERGRLPRLRGFGEPPVPDVD